MKYPNFLQLADTIGIVAPSFGITDDVKKIKFEFATKSFEELGYSIVPSKQVFTRYKGASASAIARAKDFMKFYCDDKIDFIIALCGGELELEILPYLNFHRLKKAKPKYFMGYSDNTFIGFLLTTICDVSSIYGPNFSNFGTQPWHKENNVCLKVIKGKKQIQENFERYEDPNKEKDESALAPIHPTRKVIWKSLFSKNVESLKGRLIGGCLDCLTFIAGSQYDYLDEFKEKYAKDGIILFLESCDLDVFGITRSLLILERCGWFKNIKGIIFGRPLHPETKKNYSIIDAYKKNLSQYNIPILYNLDIGHVAPALTLFNGACVEISLLDGEGKIETLFY